MAGKPFNYSADEIRMMRGLGVRLRQRRESLGLRQTDVAFRAGLSQGTLSAVEAGLKSGVSYVTILRIAAVLEIDPTAD